MKSYMGEIKLMRKNIVMIRGGGDIGTAIAHKLHRSGFKVLVLEVPHPMVIRRRVSFAEAIFHGEVVVEGIRAVKTEGLEKIMQVWEDGDIPVVIDKDCALMNEIPIDVMIDAIIAKKNLGTSIDMAPITIAVGPGFEAGVDADVVIETNRGHNLARLIFEGFPEANTGIPGNIGGYDRERVIKAPCAGKIKLISDIGRVVKRGETIAYIEEVPVKATIDGVLRGMIYENTLVTEGLKIADIDPRGCIEYCYTMSDKSRAIAGGVLEAIFYMKRKKNISL